tara:strand:+ start:211 stop:486 length:276 start_codon:yes stop_codon:yes gene_type:complete
MVKSELIKKLCDSYPNILRKDIEKILDIIFLEITAALKRGENVEIRGFGSYKIKKRKARIGRNPKNSQQVNIPEKRAIKWKMSKILYNRLN